MKTLTPIERAIKFNNWMLNKIKSIHYANNEQMCKAYEKIYETT